MPQLVRQAVAQARRGAAPEMDRAKKRPRARRPRAKAPERQEETNVSNDDWAAAALRSLIRRAVQAYVDEPERATVAWMRRPR